ncbi:MAG: metal-sulfur cluster assembly factor [Gammaproteobacteria bacterium]
MDGDRRSEILDALRDVMDPEIGINVVDLGLVYEAEARDGHVRVVMTMTTPACPLDESIADEARASIQRCVPGVTSVTVDLVSEPRWQPSMMSSTARERLGWT